MNVTYQLFKRENADYIQYKGMLQVPGDNQQWMGYQQGLIVVKRHVGHHNNVGVQKQIRPVVI